MKASKSDYDSTHPIPTDQILGYTSDDLLLDNDMKWWSPDEYPWSGNNTAGQWICDGMKWKAAQNWGQCDLSIEAGGGVRSDIPAGPVTFMQVYETFPWSDDLLVRINMTGQDIINFLKATNCDAGFSRELDVTAHDGIPTLVRIRDAQGVLNPIDLNHVYTVAINDYMYAHPPANYDWPVQTPLTSSILCRDALVQFMQTWPASNQYTVGGPRYHLDTEFAGGYRAVVTMMNDNDSNPTFDDAFIRFISATPDTLRHRGTNQVPTWFVQEDGTVNASNRLSEIELFRSYLGFKKNALHQGDILEVWGKGSFYGGDPEFVDQEGIYGDGIEFKILGNDPSLAKPTFVSSAAAISDDNYKNHYIKFLARVTDTSSVADQFGRVVTTWDATAYAKKTGIGNIGDFVFVTGVPTSESYAMRFRCDKVEPATGVSSFPTPSNVMSNVAAVAPLSTTGQVALTANASLTPNQFLLNPSDDVAVSSGNPNTNYNTATGNANWNLYLQSSTLSFGNERGWLKFDLSSVPPGATITNAKLSMYCWKALGPALVTELDAAGDGWTEGALTWNTQPAIGSVLVTQTLTSGTVNLWYDWDVTAYVQQELQGDKRASFVLKAQTEDLASSPSYAFDAKEYGSNTPVLTITTAPTNATVASVQYYYRYSTDGTNWGNWTATATTPPTSAPYSDQFALPNGYGYYEFYSEATDDQNQSESAPIFAQTSEHYVAPATNITLASVAISNLSQTYSGAPRSASVTTTPSGLSIMVTYNGSTLAPVHAGNYTVEGSVTQPDYTGSGSDTLVIARAPQTLTFNPLSSVQTGAAPFSLTASTTSGLPITYVSSNPNVASIVGNLVTVVGAGSTTITATQAGNTDILPAMESQPLAVTQGTVAVPAAPVGLLYALAAGLLTIGGILLRRRALARGQ